MKDQFDAGYPNTPASFRLVLDKTCKEIERMDTANGKRRMKRGTALVAALIATLLLAGLGYAAVRSQILDRLFGGGQPNKQAEALVQPIDQSITQDGITVSFDECVVDGERWYLGYHIKSQREDTVLYTSAWDSSLLQEHKLLDEDGWSMGVLGGSIGGVAMPTEAGGACTQDTITFSALPTPDEPFEVTLKVRVAKPKMELVLWNKPSSDEFETYAPISKREWKQYKKDKQIPVYAHGVTEFPKWISAIDDAPRVGLMKLSEKAGCVEPFAEITLTTTIDPGNSPRQAHTRLAEPQRFDFEDYVLEVDVVDLTPTRSDIRFNVVPKQWPEEGGLSVDAYSARFGRDYDLLNEEGERIQGSRYGIVSDTIDDFTRSKKFHYSHSAPLAELPETLVIAPILWQGQGAERTVKAHDMAHAVTLELGDAFAAKTTARTLPEIESIAQTFFGAEVDTLQRETSSSRLEGSEQWSDLARHQGDHIERYIELEPSSGRFSMSKPSEISMPGSFGANDAEVSDVPGKYTQQEAIALARAFLEDALGVDVSLLTAQVVPESERKLRSRRYEIGFEYRHDGIPMTSEDPSIRVDVTDEGIVYAQGHSLETRKP